MSILSTPLPVEHSTASGTIASAARLAEACVRIGDRWALRDITIDLGLGTSLGVLGANGAGKSTLLRVMSTLLRPTRGSVELFPRCVPVVRSPRHLVGFIGHQSMLYTELSARENLEFFARLYQLSNPRKRVADMLDLVELSSRSTDPVRNLSRGMTQRVAVARALLHAPKLVLADEPFTGLDERSRNIVTQCLLDQHRQGSALVMTSHDIDSTLSTAQRVLVLRDGATALQAASVSTTTDAVRAAIGGGE